MTLFGIIAVLAVVGVILLLINLAGRKFGAPATWLSFLNWTVGVLLVLWLLYVVFGPIGRYDIPVGRAR